MLDSDVYLGCLSRMFVSDVYPGRHEDVLDVERVPQRHLHHHPDHGDEQKSGDAETHRSPRLEDLLAPAGEGRPRIARRSSPDPPIKSYISDHEIRPDHEQTEERRHEVVAEPEHIRKVDVNQRFDQMRIPNLTGPEPVPSGTAEKGPDDDERHPQDVEAEEKSEQLEGPLLKCVVAVALRIDVEVRHQHQ